MPAVDIVGTGGDRAQTVNISTMAALVTAGSGRTVVKHGNRAASSACGTADVLEELGVAIDLPAAGVAATVAEAGIGFCFAPVFHAGFRHTAGPRRELGVPTAFNFLGPLTNPGRPAAAAIGVYNAALAPVMAQVLADRGDSALVFRGDDGLDELTTTTTSRVWLVADGQVRAGPAGSERARAGRRPSRRRWSAAMPRSTPRWCADLLDRRDRAGAGCGAAQRGGRDRRLRRSSSARPGRRSSTGCRSRRPPSTTVRPAGCWPTG